MYVPLLPIAATADSDRSTDGQYFCVVEHVAGVINTDKEGGRTMYSGNINLAEQETKFFIKVGPVVHDDVAREVCERQFKKILEKGTAGFLEWTGYNCLASNEIIWKSPDGKLTLPFRGYGGFGYYGAEPSTWFEFYNDAGHTFQMGLGHLYGGPVIEHGHCTKIEPPK
jgi:hypothetical protein